MATASHLRVLACALGLTVLAGAAHADTLVIDDTTVGTVYDGILDGFPFPPPGITPDGTGDFTNNALAVALQTGVTEERGIAELPLASLDGLGSADIESATLTFNIDDVVGTFGPGTTFDGTAAETIVLFRYAGNGTIDLADFGNVVGAPLEVVSTTALGTITDATLAVQRPARLRGRRDRRARCPARRFRHAPGHRVHHQRRRIGHLDRQPRRRRRRPAGRRRRAHAVPHRRDRGRRTADLRQPPSSTARRRSARAARSWPRPCTRRSPSASTACSAAISKAEPLTAITTKCTDRLDPGNPASKVGKAIAKLQSGITDKCASLAPADVGSPCDAGATTMAQVATCVVSQHMTGVVGPGRR